MRSAAMQEAVLKGARPFPVLRIDLVARGMALGDVIACPSPRQLDAGNVTHLTQPGGWSTIEYGNSVKDNGLRAVPASVGIIDKEGDLLSILETYDPRGSAASIDSAVDGMANVDWEPLFRGVLSDWERKEPYTILHLKTDDTVLRTPVPSGVFARAEWGGAVDGTIFGTHMPLVTGIHNSFDVTARGMVPAINIRWDKDNGYWWLASVDRMIEITRIYFDGAPQGTAGWSVKRGVFGGNYLTIIDIQSAYLPKTDDGQLVEGTVVAFDCEAMDENGLITGNTLTGAPDILKAIISEYGYRRPPLAGWRGDHTIIGDGWDTVSDFFALHKIEAARRFGGDQDPESLAEVIDSFLQAYPWVKIWWDELGKLSITVIDPDDVDPDDTKWLDLAKYHDGGGLPFRPGDRREVYTHINMPFMWSSAEQKFLSAYEAHDVAALDEKVVLVMDNPWSQAQFNESGTYNPAAPADPTIPGFTITLTGTGAATATLYLVTPESNWDPDDPLTRNAGVDTLTASGSTIFINSDDLSHWGNTYSLLFKGSTLQWGKLNQAVTIANGSLAVSLSVQTVVGQVGAVAEVLANTGETIGVADCFSGDPTDNGTKAIIYWDSNGATLVEDTWSNGAWSGTQSAALPEVNGAIINCWWYNEAFADYAVSALTVTTP